MKEDVDAWERPERERMDPCLLIAVTPNPASARSLCRRDGRSTMYIYSLVLGAFGRESNGSNYRE